MVNFNTELNFELIQKINLIVWREHNIKKTKKTIFFSFFRYIIVSIKHLLNCNLQNNFLANILQIKIIYIFIYVCVCVSPLAIVRVFANGLRDLGRVISKPQKLVLDAYLLNTQHSKVWIKGKLSNPEKGVVPSPTPWCCRYWKESL